MFKIFLALNGAFICMRNTSIEVDTVCSVYFAISYARSSFFGYLISCNSCSSENIGCNITELFVLHTIRTKLFYQLFKFGHHNHLLFAQSRITCSFILIKSFSAVLASKSVYFTFALGKNVPQ